jgi:hypothetical protein
MITRLFIILAAVICFATSAQAHFVNVPASACMPDSMAIRFNRYVTMNAAVRHAPGNVDKITLICPITNFFNSNTNWTLMLTYLDSTGALAAAYVRAYLFAMAFGTATPDIITNVNSNSSSDTTVNAVSRNFTHTFDFDNYTYWVRIELDRTEATQVVIAYSVALGLFAPSDRRLKHEIELLGRLDNGLGFYRFAYNGSDKAWVGVMAQEVQAVMPDAVMRGDDGYLRVAYGRLGFPMQSYEDWLAAGGKLPAATKH